MAAVNNTLCRKLIQGSTPSTDAFKEEFIIYYRFNSFYEFNIFSLTIDDNHYANNWNEPSDIYSKQCFPNCFNTYFTSYTYFPYYRKTF